jgi:hypothetical protein
VPLVDGGVRGEAVEVPVPIDIPQPDAFAPGQNDIERVVVVCTETLLGGDEFYWRWHKHSHDR